MSEYHLRTPLDEAAVRRLELEDRVYLNGSLFGIRDATQIRIFDEGICPPTDLTGGKYEKISIGTTTSTRMDRFVPGLLREYGVRAIVGKAGLLAGSVEAMKQFGAAYLAIVGGAAALETQQIEEIEQVWWEDLMPECLWKFRVREFGPLIVAIDAHGRSLYQRVQDQVALRIKSMNLA
jgi:L(+)-tartrate dehydratase beta subunit